MPGEAHSPRLGVGPRVLPASGLGLLRGLCSFPSHRFGVFDVLSHRPYPPNPTFSPTHHVFFSAKASSRLQARGGHLRRSHV